MVLLCNVFTGVFFQVSYAQQIHHNNQDKALDLQLLINDKEEKSLIVSKSKAKYLKSKYPLSSQNLIKSIFYSSVLEIKETRFDETNCNLGIINHFVEKLNDSEFNIDEYQVTKFKVDEYLYLLRSANSIDDIFLGLLLELNKLKFKLDSVDSNTYVSNIKISSKQVKLIKKYGLSMYTNLNPWPKEDTVCSLGIWSRIKKSTRKKDLKGLNRAAFASKVIPANVFLKVEVFRKSKILKEKYI